jgi:hypothetical protein
MALLKLKSYFITFIILTFSLEGFGQETVPFGIHYQAVARDNYGKELSDRVIDIRFSIISENPLGPLVYQELHSKVKTSKYGVFSLVIGHGTNTGGSVSQLSQINWAQAFHYLKVEVKFESVFMDMGTMQFLAVPYALYAQKSLEPGPAGPKGDPGPKGDAGDPSTDNQTISFDQSNLSISGGNSVPLTSLLQNLTITSSPEGNYLGISRGNSVLLANIEADGDPKNEIQDLIYDAAKREIRLLKSTAPAIDLSELKNDADANPANELQNLTYNQASNSVSISGGNSISLGNMVAFRARKLLSTTVSSMTDVTFIPSTVEYNDGNAFNDASGEFIAPLTGIYTFSINYYADGSGGSRKLILYYNSAVYEEIAIELAAYSLTTRSITMKLTANSVVKLVINSGASTQSGTGSFSGFRVN